MARFPVEIREFAALFTEMQDKREAADYNPAGSFEQSSVIADVNSSVDAIAQFRQSPERDRRAFAVYVLLNIRNN